MAKQDKDKPKRLADLAGVGATFEGGGVKMTDIEGQEVTIVDFKFIPSQFRQGEEFLSVQLHIDGELQVMNTGASVIMQSFKNITREQLPLLAVFKKAKSETSGRSYWTIE